MRNIKKVLFVMLLTASIVYGLWTTSYAAVPHLINYQGRLTDSGGIPLNGSYALTFRIYDAETAGNLLWEETHSGVVIQKGIFSILLGSVTNLDLPFDKQYFLEIKVGNEIMSPKQQITSAGYAITADSVKGSENIFPGSGNVGIGTTGPGAKLEVNGDLMISSTNPLKLLGPAESIRYDNAAISPLHGMLFTAHGTRNFIFGTYDGTTYSGTRMVISNSGNVGIGTTNPSVKLEVAGRIGADSIRRRNCYWLDNNSNECVCPDGYYLAGIRDQYSEPERVCCYCCTP